MNGAKPGEGMDNHSGEHIRRVSVYGCDRNLRYSWVVNPPPGFAVAAIIGRRDDEMLPAAAVAELTAFKQSAIDTGQSRLGEFEICFSGDPRIYQVAADPVRDAGGQVSGLTVTACDVTDRHRAVRALAESQTRLELATAAADIGIWDWDLTSNRFDYSPRARVICGLAPNRDVTFDVVRGITHPDDYPFTHAQAKRALDPAVRDKSPYEYRIVRPDGEIRWVIAHGEAVFAGETGNERAVRYTGTIQDITQRRLLEQAERDNTQRLRLALDAGRMAVWEVDLAKGVVTTSPELNRLLGYSDRATPTLAELEGRYYPGEHERVQQIARSALARDEHSFEAEYRYVRPDGQIRWLMIRADMHFESAERPSKIIGVLMDITGRKHTEEALGSNRERLRLGLEAGRMVAWEYDLDSGTVTRSDNADDIFGPGMQAADFTARMPPEDAESDRLRMEAAVSGQSDTYDSEFRYHHPDGNQLWLHTQGIVIRDDAGVAKRVHGVCIDITARKMSQEALRDETYALDILNRTGARIAAELDLSKLVQLVVDAGVELAGAQIGAFFYTVTAGTDESLMVYALSGVPPEAFAKFPNPRNTAVFAPTFRGEGIVRSDDIAADPRYGHNLPHRGLPQDHPPIRSYLAVPVMSRSGDVIGALFFGHERTGVFDERAERLIAGIAGQAAIGIDNARLLQTVQGLNQTLEGQVAERTAERDRLWELSEDLLVLADFRGQLLRISPSWRQVLGYEQAVLQSAHYKALVHPDDWAAVARALESMRTAGRPAQFENRLRAADGLWRWVAWHFSPDPVSGYLHGVGRDVTAEKARTAALRDAEDALRQAQKMEAIGQLTGGIAHDFNNLLTGISGSLELLRTRLAQGRLADLDRYIAAAAASVTRAAGLTHRLLAFARRQTLTPKSTDINKLVAGMEELIRRTTGPAIQVETVGAAGLWPTLCDANQLESALLNLCINARDAMPEGGRLTIETGNAHLDEAYTATERDVRAGQYVSLTVTDTGTGMTPDVVARAFEPFYTTKPIGQGTGLGLSMLYGFVKQSEGHVRIYSEVGRGTSVRLYLPRHDRGMADGDTGLAIAGPETVPPGAGETVLVVEDETIVRALIIELLADLGYAALEAADGPSGLKILQSQVRVDLLVTDVGLPGLNGRQLADAAREWRPDLKVLFITGYAHNAAIGNGLLAPGMDIIVKPFALSVLATKIRAMIERQPGSAGMFGTPEGRS